MKTMEWSTADKTGWGDGPWMSEPDKKQWVDEATGLPCLIVRGPQGALCGYVGVSQGHPCYRKNYVAADVDGVHGGLTFSDHCQPHKDGDEGRFICHVVEPGEDDKVWWLGFDCAHSWDIAPKLAADPRMVSLYPMSDDAAYRDWDYVSQEVASLARQLAGKVQ